jgi:hypothetical protein
MPAVRRSHRLAILACAGAALALAAGCVAPRGRGTSRAHSAPACDRADQDTSHYLHVPLYRACAVYVQARPISTDLRPDFVPTQRGRTCYSAVIEVAIDTRGLPEVGTARVVRTNDARYAQAVLAAVPNVSFEPAVLGGRRVRQIVQLRQSLVVRRRRRTDGPSGPDLPMPSAPMPC